MIVLPNVYFDTWRSPYSSVAGTDTTEPYLKSIEGHLTRIKDSPLVPYPSSVVKAEYEIYTDITIDIQRGDNIKNIIRKDSGKLWFLGNDTEVWVVLDVNNSSPGFAEYRDIVIGRYVSGGPL